MENRHIMCRAGFAEVADTMTDTTSHPQGSRKDMELFSCGPFY